MSESCEKHSMRLSSRADDLSATFGFRAKKGFVMRHRGKPVCHRFRGGFCYNAFCSSCPPGPASGAKRSDEQNDGGAAEEQLSAAEAQMKWVGAVSK